jgi:asparagine N-glycosylation enzyme membrane subunit Stt3
MKKYFNIKLQRTFALLSIIFILFALLWQPFYYGFRLFLLLAVIEFIVLNYKEAFSTMCRCGLLR